MTASFTGMPISGTHTVVGALVGAGLVGSNNISDGINWKKLRDILISWVATPLCSTIITCCLMTTVSFLTMNTKRFSYRFRLIGMQIIAGVCVSALGYLFDSLFNKKLRLNTSNFCAKEDS
jgi:phosphate/sulfate permease